MNLFYFIFAFEEIIQGKIKYLKKMNFLNVFQLIKWINIIYPRKRFWKNAITNKIWSTSLYIGPRFLFPVLTLFIKFYRNIEVPYFIIYELSNDPTINLNTVWNMEQTDQRYKNGSKSVYGR